MIKNRSFAMYLLLSIVTCGIYPIFFWYSFSQDVNRICNGDGKNTQNYLIVILLSIVTCGIYMFIWLYGVGNRLQENGPRYGVAISENGTSVLLWLIFGSLICGIGQFYAYYLLIKNINILGDRYNQQFYGGQYQQPYNQ